MYSVKHFVPDDYSRSFVILFAEPEESIQYRQELSIFKNEPKFVVVLSQETGNTTDSKQIQYYQLFDGKEKASKKAFRLLQHFFEPLLSHGKAAVDEELLGKLITSEGPVQEDDKLIRIIVDWDNAEALKLLAFGLNSDPKENGDPGHVISKCILAVYNLAAEKHKKNILKVLFPFHKRLTDLDRDLPTWAEKIDHMIRLPREDGHSCLTLDVTKGRFDLVMAKLLANADPSYPNSLTHKTPLHYAAEGGFTDIVIALIAFGADINVKDKEGRTPIEVARVSKAPGAAECYAALKKVVDAIDKSPSDVEMSDTSCPEGDCILALDGGGARGLIEALILSEIEKEVKRMCPEVKSIIQCFDVVAGTSTGSFFIAGLVYGEYTLSQMRDKYFSVFEKLFGSAHSKPLPATFVDSLVQEAFGNASTLTLDQTTTPKVIFCSTLATHSPPFLHLMCNYGKPRQGQVGPADRKVWEAARASSSAPGYFETFQDRFLDGGFIANNPTLAAITETLDGCGQDIPGKLCLVLSLGTGVWPAEEVTSVNIPGFSWKSPFGSLYSSARGLVHIGKILIGEVTNNNGHEIDQARIWCKSINCEYVRLSPEVDSLNLDETDHRKLTKMMFQAYLYTLERQDTIRQTAMLLAKKFKKSSINPRS